MLKAETAHELNAALGRSGLAGLRDEVAERFATYLELLQRWNAKLNLTAIRTPGEILHRHFVECIFCARQLPSGIESLLDYGSGGGFPGIPIALCRPEICVTLGESQGKKAAFLQECVRVLELKAEVFSGRVEEMGSARSFDAVALRAVDRMQTAIEQATSRITRGGWLVLLTSEGGYTDPAGFLIQERRLPCSSKGVLVIAQRALQESS